MKVKIQLTERSAAMTQLPQPADGLHPAEALLDEFPLLLTDGIARRAASCARSMALRLGRRVYWATCGVTPIARSIRRRSRACRSPCRRRR